MRYLIVLVFLLSGCSAIQKLDKSDEYKSAPAHDQKLILPRGANTKIIESHYLVPKACLLYTSDAADE